VGLLVAISAVLQAEWTQLKTFGSPRHLAWVSLGFFPVLFSFLNGQTSMLLLAPLVGWVVLLRRDREFAAGLVLGLLAIKPQVALGPVVILIGARRWRALLGAAASASCWIAIGILVMPGAMVEYLRVMPHLVSFLRQEDYQTWGQTSLFGLSTLLLDPLAYRLGGWVGTLLVTAGILANALLAYRLPWKPGTASWDLGIAACLALGFIASPHLFLYDVSLLLLPLCIVVARLQGEHRYRLLDGGPVLVAVGILAVGCFLGPFLSLAGQNLLRALGLPRSVLQLCTLAIVWFVYAVARRAAREPSELSTTLVSMRRE
jgi:hypothetical protein